MTEPVETVVHVGDRRVHRFQLLRERRPDEPPRDWVVVELGKTELTLATPDFAWTRTIELDAVARGAYEPLVADGVPVWGY